MSKNTTHLGNQAETAASNYLEKLGYKLLERNFRNRYCEIDIIAKHQDYLVFIEVRYRRSNFYGEPIDTITHNKLRRIKRAVDFYLTENPEFINTSPRIDIIGISGEFNSPQITHIENCY